MARGLRIASTPAVRDTWYVVRPLVDAGSIRARLERERGYAAYALGQLAPPLFPLVRCWEARGPSGAALALYSRGGLGDAVFMTGETAALAALLSLHRGPRHNFATFLPAHLPAVERYFSVTTTHLMMRMLVDRASFRPARPLGRFGITVRRLTGGDARAVNRLYSSEGPPTFYSAAHIDQGMYHGVFEGQELVAVAGTHVIAPDEGVAVVGNVFTHPGQRGLGYGTLATSATTAALLQRCHDVALTVDPENTPAVRAYLRLGYREGTRLIESAITRRPASAVGRFLAARIAAFRGRAERAELVRGVRISQ